MSPSRPVRVLAAACFTFVPVLAAAGQSSFAVSPFVSYIPSAATNPLAGFALTFGGTTGLALRSGAEMSISNPRIDSAAAQPGGIRPWAADADAMLFLSGLGGGATVFRRSLSPYVFAGIGLAGEDSAGRNVTRNGWSYGAGAMIPLGMFADIFAEARWRMPEYVLPTSQGAPDSRSAMRFGLSFHVGGSGAPARGASRPRRHRYEAAEQQDDDVEYVVTPAPAPQPVVVVPAQSEPQIVVIEQQPAPQPVLIESVPEPAPVVVTQSRVRRRAAAITTAPRTTVIRRPGGMRGTSRVLARRSAGARTQPAPAGSTVRSRVIRPPSAGATARSRVIRTPSAGAVSKATQRVRAKAQAQAKAPAAGSRTKQVTSTRARREPQ
jgi:hypothetical protein